jgi:hypothetical protein
MVGWGGGGDGNSLKNKTNKEHNNWADKFSMLEKLREESKGEVVFILYVLCSK